MKSWAFPEETQIWKIRIFLNELTEKKYFFFLFQTVVIFLKNVNFTGKWRHATLLKKDSNTGVFLWNLWMF